MLVKEIEKVITQLERFAQKSKMAIITYNIYNNWRIKRRFNSGNYKTSIGSTHSRMTLSESLDYINRVFGDYLRYSGMAIEDLQDKRILEIGPGDNLGVALMFLASGSAQVVSLDKFLSKRESEQERKIYQELRRQLNDYSRELFDTIINLDGKIEINSDKLRYIYGHGIEEANDFLEPESFDFIVSRAVLEGIYDIDAAFSVMNSLLIPGGLMIHKIDLRDYGMFSGFGMHPLTFLTIPDSIYRLMTKESGRPNRRLINYYRQKMIDLGYDTKIFVTHILGREEEVLPHKERIELNVDYSEATISLLNKIHPKLNNRFKDLSDEELIVSGIFFTARKPE